MRISVTAEDIMDGIPGDCDNCPLVFAMSRAIPGAFAVTVGGDNAIAYFWVGEGVEQRQSQRTFALPKEARDFVEHFDMTRYGQPFSFELQ